MAAGLLVAYKRAASTMSFSGTQVISATRSAGYSFTLSQKTSHTVLQEILFPSERATSYLPFNAGSTSAALYVTSSDSQIAGSSPTVSQTTKLSGEPVFVKSLARNSFPVSLLIRKGAFVHFSTNPRSYNSSLTITLRKPIASAPSVPGLSWSHFFAREANHDSLGSMQMISVPFFIRSMIQCPKTLSGHVAGIL